MFGRIIRLPRLIASFLQESGNLWAIGHSVEVIRPLTLVCNVLNEIRKKKNKENEVYTTNIDDLSTKFIHLMHSALNALNGRDKKKTVKKRSG